MKPKIVFRTYAHFDDGTGWPLPDRGDDDHDSLEWVLRYGQPTRSQILQAASVLAAYEALIRLPQRRRNEVAGAIREAAELAQNRVVTSNGEWRCRCPSDPKFDRSINPPSVKRCCACGAERPLPLDRDAVRR